MSKLIRKLIAGVLAAALLCGLSACSSGSKKASGSASADALSLPFSASDTTDPYDCKSESNALLTGLIYESLFTIGEDRTLTPCLAASYIAENNTITVNLKQAEFSNGKPVTSDDVIYSFYAARESARFQSMLSGFETAERKGSGVVRFVLAQADVYAPGALTFPIIYQKDSLIGSGRYALSEKEGVYTLEYNKNFAGEKPHFTTIFLVECADYSGALRLFNSEKIDYLFDTLEDGNVRSSAINSQKAKLNNLLFLGINANKGLLKKGAFRNAISLAVNQTALCEQALEGYAVPTATPFDPQWSEIGSVVCNSVLEKRNEAEQAFADAGCVHDKMNINLMYNDEQIELSLIVNSANNMKIALANQIKTQLVNYGISIDVKKMPLDEYIIAVENGNFDLYIGEVKIENTFNLDCFFKDNGGAHFGINDEHLQNTYASFKAGDASLQDFVSEFSAQNPLIPIAYKCANVCAAPSLKNIGTVSENNVYAAIEEWSK